MDRWATFDCYGTLIDWDGGIGDVLAGLWPAEDRSRLLAGYHALEAVVERDGSLSYRAVLEHTLRKLAASQALPLDEENATALAESLPRWPPFSEVPAALAALRSDGWKLAILSNTDPDLLDASIAAMGVEIDMRIVASDIGSYKPGHRHWEEFRRITGGTSSTQGHVHVAASVFHDLEPCAELAIPAVWINRTGETSHVTRAAELTDLEQLAASLDRVLRPR